MARKLNSTNVGTSKASASMGAGKKTTKRTTKPRGGAGKPTGSTGIVRKGKVKGNTLQKSDPSGVKGTTGTAKIKGGKSPRTYKANLSAKKGSSGKGWRPKGRK